MLDEEKKSRSLKEQLNFWKVKFADCFCDSSINKENLSSGRMEGFKAKD